MQTATAKPFLRWAGSKKKLILELADYWSGNFIRYFEPFAGSACLFFELNPKRAVLGDLNCELIRTYKVVKKQPASLARSLSQIQHSQDEYYHRRSLDPKKLGDLQRASRFIYLNRHCFNGLYRTNQKGQFNVPLGSGRTGQLPSHSQLMEISRVLSRAALRTGDFISTTADAGENDFVYMDPPFAVGNRRVFRQYGPDSFGLEDLARLASLLDDLDTRGAKFLVSYALCSEARQLFANWDCRRVRIRRNISGFSSSRRHAYEMLISN